jgi:hypothetical protein
MVFHQATTVTILMSLPSLLFSYNSYQKDVRAKHRNVLKSDALFPPPSKIKVSDTSALLLLIILILFSYILCLCLSLSQFFRLLLA